MQEKTSEEDLIYVRTRAAHLLTGVNRALELLNREREELVAILNGPSKRLGRPPNVVIDENATPAIVASVSRGSGIKEWWTKKTPEERSAEMRRRLDVRHAKQRGELTIELPRAPEPAPEPVKKAKGHPHPRKGKPSRWWASLTPEQKKAHAAKARKAMMKAMGYGKKKQLVNGHAKTEARAAA